MPLTAKGKKLLVKFKKQYGDKKGEEVFYKSQQKGTITGTHKKHKKKSKRKKAK
jgi:hypothetical protein